MQLSSPIDYKGFYPKSGFDVYRLNENKLSKNECHIFYPSFPCAATVLITALEHLTFHPKTPLNEKFIIRIVKCGKFDLTWCSFPKEFKEVCERIGAHYRLKLINESRAVIVESNVLEVPKADNILIFDQSPPNLYLIEEIERECEEVIKLGDCMNQLGVD